MIINNHLKKHEKENMMNNIRDIYYKAFYDCIDQAVNVDKPDYEWVLKLYIEIKTRILKYVKQDSNTYKMIDDNFDVDLFKQMIENNAFDETSMKQLIDKTFYWINKLQAPYRDTTTNESKNVILNAESSKIISTYIREVNKCLDNLDEDMTKYI